MTTIRVRLYVVPTRDREEILVFIQHFVVLELELGWNWRSLDPSLETI